MLLSCYLCCLEADNKASSSSSLINIVQNDLNNIDDKKANEKSVTHHNDIDSGTNF